MSSEKGESIHRPNGSYSAHPPPPKAPAQTVPTVPAVQAVPIFPAQEVPTVPTVLSSANEDGTHRFTNSNGAAIGAPRSHQEDQDSRQGTEGTRGRQGQAQGGVQDRLQAQNQQHKNQQHKNQQHKNQQEQKLQRDGPSTRPGPGSFPHGRSGGAQYVLALLLPQGLPAWRLPGWRVPGWLLPPGLPAWRVPAWKVPGWKVPGWRLPGWLLPPGLPAWELLWFGVIADVSIASMNLSLMLNSIGFYQVHTKKKKKKKKKGSLESMLLSTSVLPAVCLLGARGACFLLLSLFLSLSVSLTCAVRRSRS